MSDTFEQLGIDGSAERELAKSAAPAAPQELSADEWREKHGNGYTHDDRVGYANYRIAALNQRLEAAENGKGELALEVDHTRVSLKYTKELWLTAEANNVALKAERDALQLALESKRQDAADRQEERDSAVAELAKLQRQIATQEEVRVENLALTNVLRKENAALRERKRWRFTPAPPEPEAENG